ncbi:hypothetical protein DFH06DRAFT_1142894 [Mycena polygramma]|nr:hypothetical protein DFH06DRAFT_1142894 [Mycena polygramma]
MSYFFERNIHRLNRMSRRRQWRVLCASRRMSGVIVCELRAHYLRQLFFAGPWTNGADVTWNHNMCFAVVWIEQEAQRPDPEQEHLIGSKEAERGRLKYSGSGLRGQFRTQGAPGSSRDEDEAQKPQAWRKSSTTRELKKGMVGGDQKSVRKTRQRDEVDVAHVDPASSELSAYPSKDLSSAGHAWPFSLANIVVAFVHFFFCRFLTLTLDTGNLFKTIETSEETSVTAASWAVEDERKKRHWVIESSRLV